jgi:hypothetical protein
MMAMNYCLDTAKAMSRKSSSITTPSIFKIYYE